MSQWLLACCHVADEALMNTYFIISVAVLAALLFLPVSKIVWTMSIRRMQRKLGRELTAAEIEGQLARARFITVFLVLVFSYLFNISLGGKLGYA